MKDLPMNLSTPPELATVIWSSVGLLLVVVFVVPLLRHRR